MGRRDRLTSREPVARRGAALPGRVARAEWAPAAATPAAQHRTATLRPMRATPPGRAVGAREMAGVLAGQAMILWAQGTAERRSMPVRVVLVRSGWEAPGHRASGST